MPVIPNKTGSGSSASADQGCRTERNQAAYIMSVFIRAALKGNSDGIRALTSIGIGKWTTARINKAIQ